MNGRVLSGRSCCQWRLVGEYNLNLRFFNDHFCLDMRKPFLDEIYRLGGDPSDEVWSWLYTHTRGPHGAAFTWGQTRDQPAGFVDLELLTKFAAEMEALIPNFRCRAQEVVRIGMRSTVPLLVRKSIQVAAVVGGEEELRLVKQFVQSDEADVASDARACAFYLKRVLRG
jgi:hypothetical protein